GLARVISLLAAALLAMLPVPALAKPGGGTPAGPEGRGTPDPQARGGTPAGKERGGTPAGSKGQKESDAWPDGLSKDSVHAATVGAASITAGRAHSCATTSTGRVYCWGSD